jgi:hypothetical protein
MDYFEDGIRRDYTQEVECNGDDCGSYKSQRQRQIDWHPSIETSDTHAANNVALSPRKSGMAFAIPSTGSA